MATPTINMTFQCTSLDWDYLWAIPDLCTGKFYHVQCLGMCRSREGGGQGGQKILMIYHGLFVNFEKAATFKLSSAANYRWQFIGYFLAHQSRFLFSASFACLCLNKFI